MGVHREYAAPRYRHYLVIITACFAIAVAAGADSRVDTHTVCLLTFDEGSGATAKDSSGNENHGELRGAEWDAGRDGQGVVLEEGDSVVMPLSDTLDLTETLTVEAWVRPARVAVRSDPICKHEGGGYALLILDGGIVSASFHIAGNYVAANAVTPLEEDTWHYIAGTYDGATLMVYVDGELEGETKVAGDVTSTNAADTPLVLGGNPGAGGDISSNFYSGTIDELLVSDVARTADEIRAAMNPTKAVHARGKLAVTWARIRSQ